MKKHVKKVSGVVGLLGLLISGTAMAQSVSNPLIVKSVEVDTATGTCDGSTGCTGNGSGTYIQFTATPTGANPAPPACRTVNDTVILFSPNGQADAIKSLTSVFTAAFLAGKSVRIFYDGLCTSGYPHVIAVNMF